MARFAVYYIDSEESLTGGKVMKKRKSVVKFRKRINIHAGLVIFALIFIYLTVSMITYITREKVSIYEVTVGRNATTANQSYTALIMRNEQVVNSQSAGYLNYFVKEGERVSLNSTIYTIDETGAINTLLSDATKNGEIIITEANEKDIRDIISNYTITKNNMEFYKINDFKTDMDSKILESINVNKIKEIIESSDKTGLSFNINNAASTGIVMYYTDGYEDLSMTNITEESFDVNKYKRKKMTTGDLIENNSFVYKVLTDEEWSVLFELSKEDVEKYKDNDTLSIKVLADEREMEGSFSIVNIGGGIYGRVDFIRYMSTYADNRFLDIQIMENEVEGLKIPKSSVTEEEFFLVPKEYITKGGDSNQYGFNKKTINGKNEETVVFITPNIAKETEEYYYVDMVDESMIKSGDILVKPNSLETYTVAATQKIKGVYNINSGYCIFKNVEIITGTGDYYLVNQETSYGLRVYDHIVLDSSLVHNNQVVFTIN